MIVQLSIATHVSTNPLLAWNQFHFLMNRWTDVSSDINPWMKQVKIKINGWTKRACHRFLPIDRCNRYQSNQIYRFLLTYRLINGYWFLPIDYSGLYPKMNLNIYVTLKFESMTTFFLYHVKWKKCFLQENMFYLISRFSLTSNQKSLVFRGTEALSDIVNVFVPAQKLFGIVRVLTNFSFIRVTDHFLLFFLAFKSMLVVLNKHVTFFGIGSFFIQRE